MIYLNYQIMIFKVFKDAWTGWTGPESRPFFIGKGEK